MFKNKYGICHALTGLLVFALLLSFPANILAGASALLAAEKARGEQALPIAVRQKDYNIVALGDSISAGYEPGMTAQSTPYGYVERLREQGLYYGRTKTFNYGILGLTSEGLKNYVTAIGSGKPVKAEAIQRGVPDPRISVLASEIAEARANIERADLITITIGGNDLYQLISDVDDYDYSIAEIEAKGEDLLNAYIFNVREVIRALNEINPEAQIILMDQYQPIPKIIGGTIYSQLQSAANSFTGAVEGIAAEFTTLGKLVKAAHVAEVFKGREIVFTHIFPGGDIHPNQAGYEAIAKVVAKEVWGSYRETEALRDGVPVNVVIKGKKLQTPYKPVLRNNQTFLAIKDITDAIGAESQWDNRSSTATVTYGGRKVVIPVGSSTIVTGGKSVPTASPAFLNKIGQESKTYVPLALLAQGLGLDVQYVEKTKTVFINL
ncbi:stalk domain-containing protein [Paenibacillus fonticola]|uniref:stalk domain-containing protein n=1 Tax=Paenibacillus fonticola TaxID=379896 RepID=UPI00035DCD46|nr:stalk domain-containing protein [Paenibacillus fonticola]